MTDPFDGAEQQSDELDYQSVPFRLVKIVRVVFRSSGPLEPMPYSDGLEGKKRNKTMTEWHGDALVDAMKRKAAQGLLAAAVLYENTLRQKVSRPSPFFVGPRKGRNYYDPSKPGEYPKLRTGAGQKAITHQPETVSEVMRLGYVRVGYIEGDHHLLALEFGKQRKGLIGLLNEMRPQLAALATAAFRTRDHEPSKTRATR